MTTYQIEFKGLPFNAVDKQVIYIESRYDQSVNEYIKSNYEGICREFEAHGLEFCYSPNLFESYANLDLLRYLAPHQTNIPSLSIDSSMLLMYLSDQTLCDQIEPSLIFLSKDGINRSRNTVMFNAITINAESLSTYGQRFMLFRAIADADTLFIPKIDTHVYACSCDDDCKRVPKRPSIFKQFSAKIGKRGVSFFNEERELLNDSEESQYVPAEFDTFEVKQLLYDLRIVVNKLKSRGVNSYWIECLINDPGKISRMVITRDYRIVLPDYNNMEISMTPIVKAVYLLFLRHPEGINYKDLVDYRDELTSIYVDIKGAPLDAKMEQSVVRATNPLDNSINEKVARIREAFVTRFDERLATNYIIHGDRGEAKRIPLHRELVEWQ